MILEAPVPALSVSFLGSVLDHLQSSVSIARSSLFPNPTNARNQAGNSIALKAGSRVYRRQQFKIEHIKLVYMIDISVFSTVL